MRATQPKKDAEHMNTWPRYEGFPPYTSDCPLRWGGHGGIVRQQRQAQEI